jgi:hypothetical protein
LIPNFGQLLGKIAFEGTVHARTRGYHGPVVLHQVSDSTFRASKLLGLDETGLRVAPAVTHAPTSLCTNCIATSLPRLRGRIARRIAWSRVSSSHDLAESITADHTAANVGEDFDKRINESVAKVQEIFRSKIPEFDTVGDSLRADMRFRSNTDSVEMAMVRQAATAEERKLRPPRVEGDPDVAVRVHRTLLTRAITDPQVRQSLAPLFGKLLKARMEQGKAAVLGKQTDGPDDAKWSLDAEWLTMDFADVRL